MVPDRRALHFKAGSSLNRGNLIRRQVAGKVIFARQKAVDARRHFRNLDKTNLLQRRTTTPVFIEGDQRQRDVRLVFANHVRAGGDRLARPVSIAFGFIPGTAAGDLAAEGIKTAFKRHVRRRVVETDGILVYDFDAGKCRPEATGNARNDRRQFFDCGRLVIGFKDGLAADRFGIAEYALLREGEGNIFGGQFVAVVELHTLAQLQFQRLVVNTLPFGGKTRNRTLIAHPVTIDQTFPEVGEKHPFADVGLFIPDIERVVVGDLLYGDRDRRACTLAERHAWQDDGAGRSRHQSQRMATVDRKHGSLLLNQMNDMGARTPSPVGRTSASGVAWKSTDKISSGGCG
ncbi:hypothetical protein D3C71_653020 [compost metagenome]